MAGVPPVMGIVVFMTDRIIETSFHFDKIPSFKRMTHGKKEVGNSQFIKKAQSPALLNMPKISLRYKLIPSTILISLCYFIDCYYISCNSHRHIIILRGFINHFESVFHNPIRTSVYTLASPFIS